MDRATSSTGKASASLGVRSQPNIRHRQLGVDEDEEAVAWWRYDHGPGGATARSPLRRHCEPVRHPTMTASRPRKAHCGGDERA
jgi:hypothetical protein